MKLEYPKPRGIRQANMGNEMEKYFLHFIFTFYLNRDTPVVEFFTVIVFQWKKRILYEVRVDPFT